jgi:hypothetical protein
MGNLSKTFALCLTIIFLTSLLTLPATTVKAVSPRTITVPDDYPTIQAAIDNASAGDTVFVKDGTYNFTKENSVLAKDYATGIFINKSISLIGEDRDKTLLSMENYQGADASVLVWSDNVTISGFTITYNHVKVSGDNCRVTGINLLHGDLIMGGRTNLISGNNILENDNVGMLVGLTDSVIEGNNVNGSDLTGINLSGTNVTVRDNNITNNGRAIYRVPSGYAIPQYVGSGLCLGKGTDFKIYENNLTQTIRFGIQFFGRTSNSSIYLNNITNNGIGINLSDMELTTFDSSIGSGNIIYDNNLIHNTKSNAVVEHESFYNLDNDMKYNHVIGTGTDVVAWDNGTVGNYWSDYEFKFNNLREIGTSGIGNQPYEIDQNNIDHYPLIRPVNFTALATNAPSPTAFVTSDLIPSFTFPIIAVIVVAVFVLSLSLYRRHRKKQLNQRYG